MPKSNRLPTDPRFPAFRAFVEAEWSYPLPDDYFYTDERPGREHEPYHSEPAKAFRLFIAGWNAAAASGGSALPDTPAAGDGSRAELNQPLKDTLA